MTTSSVRQVVTVADGFAYGTIGADIHLSPKQRPLYLLRNWSPANRPDQRWLRAVPSRMLNAAFGVVGFTGRKEPLAGLHDWLDTSGRLGIRWLHGPGGSGKSRLAARLAAEAAAAGWKVITAVHGSGAVLPPPGSQDLRTDRAVGILLIADYADRWPLPDLGWLMANGALHRDARPTRILLIGRTDSLWPAVRAGSADLGAAYTDQAVPALGPIADRQIMFDAGRDSFAVVYDLDPARVHPPIALDHPDLGLALSLHVAALVAVDAAARARSTPSELAAMSSYLLDREQRHWQDRYDQGRKDNRPTAYRTPARTMNQAVFTAALTGPVAPPTAVKALTPDEAPNGDGDQPAAETVLRDHARIYPAAIGDDRSGPDGRSVLEPIYPDRLAEDLVALTVAGHDAEYPAQPWACRRATETVTADLSEAVTRRAIVFLTAAAERWEHLGQTLVHPLLRAQPSLALAGGSAAMTSLARTPFVERTLLEGIESTFPEGRHLDLDAGMAAITERLAEQQLRGADPAEQVRILRNLAKRLSFAGRFVGARASMVEAVRIAREIVDRSAVPESRADLARLGTALTELGLRMWENGDSRSALAVADEACDLYAGALGGGSERAAEARCYANRGVYLGVLGRFEEALTDTERSVELNRRAVVAGDMSAEDELARTVYNLSSHLFVLGRVQSALAAAEEALDVRRKQATRSFATYGPDLGLAWISVARCQEYLVHFDAALQAAEQGVDIYRKVVEKNPEPYRQRLAGAVIALAQCQSRAGHKAAARTTALEAVSMFTALVAVNPLAHESSLAAALTELSDINAELGGWDEAMAAQERAIEIRRRLAALDPDGRDSGLAYELTRLGRRLQEVGRHDDGLRAQEEAITLRRSLYEREPGQQANELANGLLQLSIQYGGLGRWADARSATEEAIDLVSQIPELNRAAWLLRMANLVHNLSIWLAKLGLEDEARARTDEGVRLYRELSALEPNENEAHLASALSEQGIRYARVSPDAALAAEEEALAIRQRLYRANPVTYADALGTSLANLSNRLAAVGRDQEALDAIEEGLALTRRLYAANVAYRGDLALRLSAKGVRLAALRRFAEALVAEEEALVLRRVLADALPAVHRSGLALSLRRYAGYLDALGRPVEARRGRREADNS